MRVISGSHRGRRLQAPDTDDTRPVMDRIKESIFSSLAADVPDARVLDLYAGAGSFGIEAMSRGAASVTFVESARAALDALRANLGSLGIDAEVRPVRVERWLDGPHPEYDLVFCDPPWPMPSEELAAVLGALAPTLDPDAVVVVTRRRGDTSPEPPGMRISDIRTHGGTTIIRYVMDR